MEYFEWVRMYGAILGDMMRAHFEFERGMFPWGEAQNNIGIKKQPYLRYPDKDIRGTAVHYAGKTVSESDFAFSR